jgi:ketosteroid isomerase-like protein
MVRRGDLAANARAWAGMRGANRHGMGLVVRLEAKHPAHVQSAARASGSAATINAERSTPVALHPNVERLRMGFEIRQRLPLNEADRAVFDDMLSEDVIWHGTGKGQWARDFVGKAAVFELFDVMAQRTGGTLEIWPERIYANDHHGVIIAGLKADFGERHHEWTEAQVFHLTPEGKLKEFWGMPDDQDLVDAFFWGGATT